MLRSNGFFVCGTSNQYLALILFTLLIFSCFTILFMISNVWAQRRWLNLGLFLALDVLQCALVGLSLIAQKTRVSEFRQFGYGTV
jgi:Na+-transporting NADH:ubiquinone oxidoreductase subunit NqrE